jgi:molybdate transport system permease protein
MEQVEVSRKIYKSNKKRYSNIIFIAFISIFTAFITGLIALAIFMILLKGLPNLRTSLLNPEIRFALRLSLFTSISSTILCILFAVPISYGMIRLDFKGKKIINSLLSIPISLPPIVSGVALLILFGNTYFGHFLSDLGLKFIFTKKGIIFAQFFVNVPYMIRVLKSTISDIDPRMEYVARTLGCNRMQSFLTVTLPLAKNGLIASIVITWAKALGEFGSVLMVAGATRMKTETLPASIYLNISCGDLNLAMTSATILIIISLSSLFIFEILSSKKLFKIPQKKQEECYVKN